MINLYSCSLRFLILCIQIFTFIVKVMISRDKFKVKTRCICEHCRKAISCCAERMSVKLCLEPNKPSEARFKRLLVRLHKDKRLHLPQPVVQAKRTGFIDAGKKGKKKFNTRTNTIGRTRFKSPLRLHWSQSVACERAGGLSTVDHFWKADFTVHTVAVVPSSQICWALLDRTRLDVVQSSQKKAQKAFLKKW